MPFLLTLPRSTIGSDGARESQGGDSHFRTANISLHDKMIVLTPTYVEAQMVYNKAQIMFALNRPVI